MKKSLLFVMAIFFLACGALSYAASPDSACTMTLDRYPGTLNMRVLTFKCTGNASGGGVASTSTANATLFSKADFVGYWISEIRTTPGTVTPPTDGTALTLSTSSPAITGISVDLCGGNCVVSHTAGKRFLTPATLPSGSIAGASLNNDLILAVSGNSVASAVFAVEVFLWRQ